MILEKYPETVKILSIIVVLSAAWCNMEQPVQAQCDWSENQKLHASDRDSYDHFGASISIDGDVMVIGADGEDYRDDLLDSAGAAYVYRYNPDESQWVEEAKLVASQRTFNAHFGYSVSVDGDTIVVGTLFGRDQYGWIPSAVYVFRYDPDGSGQWVEEAKLTASDGVVNDYFGYSVSHHGDVIIVGAPRYYSDISYGAAYIFRYNGTEWVEEAKLIASDEVSDDKFGTSVSIFGDTVAVGAPSEDNNGHDSGSTYVFRHDPDGSGQWIMEAELVASDGDTYDNFGNAVSMDRDVIVMGAKYDSDHGDASGSVYVFRYDPDGSGQWVEESKLTASDGDEYNYLGYAVSIDGDTFVAGALTNVVNGHSAGAAYVFRYIDAQWVEESKLLASDGASSDHFGNAVSADDDMIVICAYGDRDGGSITYEGSAYVFDVEGCNPNLNIVPDPLLAGQIGTFTADKMTPNTQTYLAYSISGLGSTFIPQLNITLDLNQPAQAWYTINSDSNGTAEWMLPVPNAGAGLDVWFQACQFELKTNVVATSID